MRAQAHTLEAFTAALLVVSGMLFALQATAVTPLSASTSNQHIETQDRASAVGVLASAAANGTLRDAVVFWNASDGGFVDAPVEGHYANGGPPNAFGAALNETFAADRIAFNVVVVYRTPDNRTAERTMVYMGSPSDNAVAATRTVVVYDGDHLAGPDADTTVGTAAANGNFYAPDAAPDGPLFNVMEVRIVAWRL